MEKKNTILLTVIAIATLLVAVVGATFAYFTAQVSTNPNDENNGVTNVKTYTLASAVMDRGKDVSSEGAYPGTTIVKPLVITGVCTDAKGCQNVNTVIEVTAEIDEAFGSDVTWTLYKGKTTNVAGQDATTDEIVCENEEHTTSGKYYTDPTCNVDFDDYDAIISGHETTTSAVTHPVVVAGDTFDTYYLVVNYKNNTDSLGTDGTVIPGTQNNQQGKSYSVTVNYKPAV